MRRRITYLILIVGILFVIQHYMQPYLYDFVLRDEWSESKYRLYYFAANLLVTIGIGVIIFFEGKHYKDMQAVGGLLILSAVMDYFRISAFPKLAFETYIISLFAGILIFAFGLVTTRNTIFKNSVGVFFLFLGLVNLIRFPVFIDMLYFYFQKFSYNISVADGYYFGTLYVNYFIIFLEFIALDAVIRENLDTFRYKSPQI